VTDSEILEEIPDDDDEVTGQVDALETALRTTPHLPRDVAMIALARQYAAMLDDANDRLAQALEEDEQRAFQRMVNVVTKVGALYAATLDKLGMSPGARPAVRGGEPHSVDPSAAALAELQSGAAPAGADPSAHLDPAVAEALASDGDLPGD
jgi:hypothetical protein